jgi:hypothetical protein
MQAASQAVVDAVDVGLGETPAASTSCWHMKAMSFMWPSTLRLAVSGQANVVGIEGAERVGRQPLVCQRVDDKHSHVGPKRTEIGLADIGCEDREQRSGMGEQQALAAIDPQ